MENDKYEYILENNDILVADGTHSNNYTEIVYASESGPQTILLHNGEYYIQADGETLLLENNQEEMDQLVINEITDTELESLPVQTHDEESNSVFQLLEDGESCEPIIYKFVSNENLDNSDDEIQPKQKKIKLEMDNSEGESIDIENILQGHDSATQFQYAILKDGKLHLRFRDSDSVEILNESENSSSEKQAVLEAANIVDLSKVTGRNLITGQTVTLDEYLERIHNKVSTTTEHETETLSAGKTFLNRKFTIGRTTTGKKLVGKILQIKAGTEDENGSEKPENEEDENAEDEILITESQVNIQELICDSTGKVLKVGELQYNKDVTAEHLEFLTKTLAGLVDMDSLRMKILNKELRVKFVEKCFEDKTQDFRKSVLHLKGYLALQIQADSQSKGEYVFVLLNNEESEQQKKFDEHSSLSVVITQDSTGHKTTRVNFYEKATDNVLPTTCKHCGREFKSLGHLNRHVSTSHSHSEKMLTCNICHIKFGDQALLSKHRRQYEHYFLCKTCGKNFTTQSSLRRHLSVHDHSLRPLECTVCSARFMDESSLCKHLIIHTGIKAYTCSICQKSFTTVGDLNFHKRIHNPVKLFYCDVCGREFTRHSNLLRHTEIHKGDTALYKCGVCECSYKFISSLTRHMVQNHM